MTGMSSLFSTHQTKSFLPHLAFSKTICTLVFAMLSYRNGFCQIYLPDSTSVRNNLANAYHLYLNTIGGGSLLYNGTEYTSAYRGILGSPLFEAEDFEIGLISYNGVLYGNIRLKYDLVSNEVIIKGFQNENISLTLERIDSFSIMKHLFIRIRADSAGGYERPHFYELMYAGKNARFLVERKKVIKKALHAEDASSFLTYNIYYVVKGNVLYPITNKKSLIRLLGGGNVMKNFLKNNKINLKKDAVNSIKKVVAFYDQLKSNHE